MRTRSSWWLPLAALGLATQVHAQTPVPPPQDAAYPGTIILDVDATDLDHRVFRVRERIPVAPGPQVLMFPRWLPGTHGPTGEIDRLAGIQIRSPAGAVIAWQRDAIDPFALRVQVPSDVSTIDVELQHLSPLDSHAGRVVMTREMLNLQWNSMLLYPAGYANPRIVFQASVRLPTGWQQASALPVQQTTADQVTYGPVSLETLVDSPVFAGRYVRRVALDGSGAARPVTLNLVADAPEQLEASEVQLQAHRNLVAQADRLFGARHFDHYDFLLSLSERMGSIGLEHHQSSENGVRPTYFKDWAKGPGARELLPHEYTHSWNGKFRRPADLLTPTYHEPMQGSLLWLYEGQTQYWGRVLAARSGLVTAEQSRHNWAQTAASMEHRAGRIWRNLQDTTQEAAMGARRRTKEWGNWQRGSDYYDESALIWLEADMLIREGTAGKRSLDDFARAFFGVHEGRMQPLAYTFDDIVSTLQAVWPHDWATFLRQRLDSHTNAPLAGLQRAGWRLVYADKPSEFAREERDEPTDDFAYSLGLTLHKDGRPQAVLWGSPAWQAGLSMATQVAAINGRVYKAERMADAVRANLDGKAPLQLLLREGDVYRTVAIDYRDGLRYPRLERLAGTPERLDAGVLMAR